MATIGTTPRPAYVYDSETDTWVPVGVGPHTHDNFIASTTIDAKGDLLVGTANDTLTRQAVGTNGTRLIADSAQTTGVAWAADTVNTVIDAKGDLLVGSADNTVTKLTVGTDGKMLVADSSTVSGLKWSETLGFAIPGNVIGNETVGFSVLGASDSGTIPSLNFKYYRSVASAGTANAEFRIQRKVDSTNMAYIGFGDQYLTLGSNNTERLKIDSAGNLQISQVFENATVSATAATGTMNYDLLTNKSVLYYTSNAGANWTWNFRGNGTTTLNSLMSIGQSLTVVTLITQGATAYYQNSQVQIDGTTASVTQKWQSAAPTAGNANSIDVYVHNIIKTANATYTVLSSQTKFV